jgi:hypothetical protein
MGADAAVRRGWRLVNAKTATPALGVAVSVGLVVAGAAILLEPALARERIRHRMANLVAVDFHRRGDLLGVVNTLNGVGPGNSGHPS